MANGGIDGGYLLGKDGEVRFAVSDYDHTQSLVIDPVLDYSTYLGGTASGDLAFGVAVDTLGNAFVTGETYNATFPLSTSPATAVGLGTPDAALATAAAIRFGNRPHRNNELTSATSAVMVANAYSIAVDPVANAACMNGATPAFAYTSPARHFPTTSRWLPWSRRTTRWPLRAERPPQAMRLSPS